MTSPGDRSEDEIVRRDRATSVLAVLGIVLGVLIWQLGSGEPFVRLIGATIIAGLVVMLSYGGIRQLGNPPARSSRSELIADPTQPPRAPLVQIESGEQSGEQSVTVRWTAARERHETVLLAYLPYETEPLVALEYPTLSDVQDPDSAAFFEALYDAQVLMTDRYPGEAFAKDYIESVRVLQRAWQVAERNARRRGIFDLADQDQQAITQAIKLLRHAERTDGAERASYADRAYALLTGLIDRRVVSVPKPAMARIEAARRPEITGNSAVDGAEER